MVNKVRKAGRIRLRICCIGFLKGFFLAMSITFLFYRSLSMAAGISIGYGVCYIFRAEKEYRRKQQYEITLEFKEGLHGISAALGAGYSIENAIEEARKDLVFLYGEDSLLAGEFSRMGRQIGLNQPVEKVLLDFADRWQTEDILHFVKVFQTAGRTGGDLISITRLAAEKISQKIEVKREIQTMIAGKKMEGRIMNLIPLGMILYFWICSPGFLDCLYQDSGKIVMTVLLIFYVFAYRWSERVSDIQV